MRAFALFRTTVGGRQEWFDVASIESIEEAVDKWTILHLASGRTVKVAATPAVVLEKIEAAANPYAE